MPKPLLRALNGEALPTPPVWIMRQAGRYLPEYRASRAKAGDFLSLCYTPELASDVTLQPVRRYGFDAAILFSDILLIAQALGLELQFTASEGPRLSTVTSSRDVARLRPHEAVREHLRPVFETIRIVSHELPVSTALIGFAGAPWTVATYMVAGRGTADQAPALALMNEDRTTFRQLIDKLTDTTVDYLSAQIEAGVDAIQLFDSWANSLSGVNFDEFILDPTRRIIGDLKARYPLVPIIVFPRGAGERYIGFSRSTGADCVAVDQTVEAEWVAQHVQIDGCVQGNLDPRLLVKGGDDLVAETRRIVCALKSGPHIFNLGHGITPDAIPDNVHRMIEAVRQS